mmetsp:Transcript_3555/g.10166  ORF Transcript_3555/g.10166 Transcript_3555/m.10166 type:complete len:682 (-) Transcript_3555:35-2080(-)
MAPDSILDKSVIRHGGSVVRSSALKVLGGGCKGCGGTGLNGTVLCKVCNGWGLMQQQGQQHGGGGARDSKKSHHQFGGGPRESRLLASLSDTGFHIVFLVDNSKSMAMCDVRGENGKPQSRSHAVFDAIEAFVQMLLGMSGVVCSLVLFSDHDSSDVMVMQPADDALLGKILAVRNATVPKWGGKYSVALNAFQQLIAGGVSIGVLLSDGRPGDPEKVYQGIMMDMKVQHGAKCILHTVSLGPEVTGHHAQGMDSLARTGGGTFTCNDRLDTKILKETFSRLSAMVSTLRSSVLMFGEKALKPVPPKELEPVDAWREMSQEERVKPEVSREMAGHIMLPPADNPKGELAAAKGDARRAFLHWKPFAQGAQRYAFHLWWLAMSQGVEKKWHLVVKESKFEVSQDTPQKVLNLFLTNHRRAEEMAKEFNKALEKALRGSFKVDVAPAFVFRLRDAGKESEVRYLTAERFISGNYVKFNSNDGWVNELAADEEGGKAAASFSHFSFVTSGGRELCVDVQGSGLKWTDPQLHSRESTYGPGDLGVHGMRLFFRSHCCNELCRSLRLRRVDPESLELGEAQAPLPHDETKVETKVEQAECVVCLDAPRSFVCKPCGHFCLCSTCVLEFDHKDKNKRLCPVCRQYVKEFASLGHAGADNPHSTYIVQKVTKTGPVDNTVLLKTKMFK